MKPLAICAVFKNEAPFMLEWIAYHHLIGFDHFVLYDNDSTDGGAERIRSSALASRVTLLHWPRRPGQLSAYRHFAYNFSDAYEWAAFIDLDEFLLPLNHGTVADLLAAQHGFSAMLVHWRVFGPSGWEQPPPGLVIDNYTWRSADDLPVNRHIKSIVRCSDLLDITVNPHEFQVKGPVCDTRGKAVSMTAIQPVACHENLVLNHYVTRSRQDWMAKIRRGSAMIEQDEPKYRQELFNHFAEVSYLQDATISRFAPRVRQLLAQKPRRVCSPLPHSDAALTIVAHVQNIGDVDGRDGDWIGMRGGGRWIEGFSMTPHHDLKPEDLEYQVLLDRDLATPWQPGGVFCGTTGMGIPIRGFALQLLGGAASRYECSYRATFVDGSESASITSPKLCSAASLAPLEAIRIDVRARDVMP